LEARIGNQRSPRFGSVGDRLAFRQRAQQARPHRLAVMVVIRNDLPVADRNPVDLHQVTQRPRVFRGQHIRRCQNVQSPQRDVPRGPDRGRHEMKSRRQRAALRP